MEATQALPVIGDGDTGFGNALNVKRTVKGFMNAGFAGILIEDQVPESDAATHIHGSASHADSVHGAVSGQCCQMSRNHLSLFWTS